MLIELGPNKSANRVPLGTSPNPLQPSYAGRLIGQTLVFLRFGLESGCNFRDRRNNNRMQRRFERVLQHFVHVFDELYVQDGEDVRRNIGEVTAEIGIAVR